VTVYVPNSGSELARLGYRQTWDKEFLAYLKKLEASKPVIVCGDFNVAHKAIDLARPKENYNKAAGFMQEEIARSSYAYQKSIESKEQIIVGVNDFLVDEPKYEGVFKIDDSIRKIQSDKLAKLRANRNQSLVDTHINSIKEAAKNDTNIMPHVIEAVECKATLGEIANALREVYGEFIG
jgi:hypothetical protein